MLEASGCRRALLPVAASGLASLPCSSLRGFIQTYVAHLRQLSDQHKAENLSAPYLRAEWTAVAQLTALLDDVEYLSCANSPFVLPSQLRCTRQEALNYTLSIVHCISRPTYGRHVKVLMLLLCELRFRILIRDARFFAEHYQSAPSLSRMRGESSAAQVAEQHALMRAFQLLDWQSYHDAAHMQMRRNALGKGKASGFAKELSLAYKQVMQATEHIGKQRQALTGCTDLSVKTREWAAAGQDMAGALEKYGAASYWVEQRDWLLGRLQSFEAAHSRVISGTEVSYLCSRLRGYVKAAFTEHVTKPPELNASEVDVAELLTFFTGSGGGALVVEVALAKFFGVVENMHVRAPELWAMNYLLHWYGVEEGIMLAHEADVVDGGFKQQGGGAFEEQFLTQENKLVVSQVLVPHCCAVTRCDEATAKAWVEACVRCKATERQGTEGASPTWPGTPPASLPPAYRLARNVNYYWKEVGEDKIGRIAGELDGVIYDATTRQVLFVLEAKQNIADVGKAFKQKERLYNALDATWKTLSQASQGAALPALQLSAENETNTATTTAAGRNATPAVEAACAASTKLHTDPVELRFFVTPTPAAEAARENVSVNGCSLVTGVGAEPAANFQDMRNSGDMAAATAPPVRSKAAAARLATAGKPFFTQDNFAAFFGATASAVHGDSTAPSPTPTRCDSMTSQHLGRDQRWIYLTSLSTGNSPGARTTVPAPGGTIHMVELTLVKAACNSVAEAYDSYFQISTLPRTATPALQSLVSAMRVCSAYAPETEPMTLFHLSLELPPQERINARAETAAVSRSNPYEYVLHLFRHDVRCKDGAAALEQVRLRENFIDGLVLSEHSLILAVDTVVKQMARRRKDVPSFCDVLQTLMQQYCVRNLVMIVGDTAACV